MLIFHASDLHFGKSSPLVVERLREEIEKIKPDLVVLSGDFTQIGSRREFRLASDLIRDIRRPVFTVPGNHDIPRSIERFFTPYARYRKYINPVLDHVYETEELYMVGINTARPILPHWNWAHGMVSKKQINFINNNFSKAPPHKLKSLVCHHPLLAAKEAPIDSIVWRDRQLVRILIDLRVDLVMTGHIHHATVTLTGGDNQLASIGAASATSTRLRRHGNGYNLISVTPETIIVHLKELDGNKFIVMQTHELNRNQPDADRVET